MGRTGLGGLLHPGPSAVPSSVRRGFVYVWPWLERRSAVAKYSSDAVIRVQPGWGIYFLQRLRGERGWEQAWKCRSGVCGVRAHAKGSGRLVHSVGLVMATGKEEECVEGLELSPLAPRGRGGCLKKRRGACVVFMAPFREEIPSSSSSSSSNSSLLGHRAGAPRDQLPTPSELKGAGREASEDVDIWERAAARPTGFGMGRAPLPWGLQHQPRASPAAAINTKRASLSPIPRKNGERGRETGPLTCKKAGSWGGCFPHAHCENHVASAVRDTRCVITPCGWSRNVDKLWMKSF